MFVSSALILCFRYLLSRNLLKIPLPGVPDLVVRRSTWQERSSNGTELANLYALGSGKKKKERYTSSAVFAQCPWDPVNCGF